MTSPHPASIEVSDVTTKFGTVTTTVVDLRAGYNVIRLAPFFGGGTGFAELGYLRLT